MNIDQPAESIPTELYYTAVVTTHSKYIQSAKAAVEFERHSVDNSPASTMYREIFAERIFAGYDKANIGYMSTDAFEKLLEYMGTNTSALYLAGRVILDRLGVVTGRARSETIKAAHRAFKLRTDRFYDMIMFGSIDAYICYDCLARLSIVPDIAATIVDAVISERLRGFKVSSHDTGTVTEYKLIVKPACAVKSLKIDITHDLYDTLLHFDNIDRVVKSPDVV